MKSSAGDLKIWRVLIGRSAIGKLWVHFLVGTCTVRCVLSLAPCDRLQIFLLRVDNHAGHEVVTIIRWTTVLNWIFRMGSVTSFLGAFYRVCSHLIAWLSWNLVSKISVNQSLCRMISPSNKNQNLLKPFKDNFFFVWNTEISNNIWNNILYFCKFCY